MIGFWLNIIASVMALGFGVIYLVKPKFMSYHQIALQKNWDELGPQFQTLVLALMRAVGGGLIAAAAAMKLEYTLPEITQTLILTRMTGRTKVPESESLEKLAAHKASMAIYLSIGLVQGVQEILARHYGDDFLCAVAVKVGHPEETILHMPVCDLAETVKREGIKSQALIVVSPALNVSKAGMARRTPAFLSSIESPTTIGRLLTASCST